MLKVAVIGCGYWGPNLIRNFIAYPGTQVTWTCDVDRQRLEKVLPQYPGLKGTVDMWEVLADPSVDAVAIATPVRTHYPIAKACLQSKKHVLVEKPLASSVAQGKDLVNLARRNDLQIMCDHTFCYTGAVRKIKEVIRSGDLGKLLYFDSVRVNLGLVQDDVNVVWDLAPHDLSIVDFIIDDKPELISAHGVSHANNNIETIAYVSLTYRGSFLAHFHLNWLSPVKIRMTMIGGTEKMLVWNDMDEAEKIKIYDKGIHVNYDNHEDKRRLLISYRSGDMYAPSVDRTEALSLVVEEFANSVIENRPPLTDGEAGLLILRILEAAEKSIKADGANVRIDYD